MGVSDLLVALRVLAQRQPAVVLLGVQPGNTDWSTELSPLGRSDDGYPGGVGDDKRAVTESTHSPHIKLFPDSDNSHMFSGDPCSEVLLISGWGAIVSRPPFGNGRTAAVRRLPGAVHYPKRAP